MNLNFTALRLDPYKWVLLPLIALLGILAFMLLQVISDLRLVQVNQNLQQYRQSEANASSAGLVARFQLIRNRIQRGYESSQDYINEGRMFAILSAEYSSDQRPQRYSFLQGPARFILNSLALFSGKEAFDYGDEKAQRMVELAYFFERRRKYEQAIALYTKAQPLFANDSEDWQYILLHRGFNYALDGKKDQATADLKTVIERGKGNNNAQTAKKLLAFIQNIDARMKQLKALPLSLQKGIAYYNLMNYRRSIDVLNLLKPASQPRFFYRGRSYEELGNINQAIADYRRTIELNPGTDLAKQANRRLYMLGAYYTGNDNLKKQAISTSKQIGDTQFIKKSEKIAKNLNKEKEKKLISSKKSRTLLTEVQKETNTDFATVLATNPENTKPLKVVTKKEKPIIITKKTTVTKQEVKKVVNPPEIKKVLTQPSQVTFNLEVYLRPRTPRRVRKQMLKQKYKTLDKINTTDGQEYLGAIIKSYRDSHDILTLRGLYNIKKVNIHSQQKVSSSALK